MAEDWLGEEGGEGSPVTVKHLDQCPSLQCQILRCRLMHMDKIADSLHKKCTTSIPELARSNKSTYIH